MYPPAYLVPWLSSTDYLMQRLRAHSGDAQLQILNERWLAATIWDQQVLQLSQENVLHRDIMVSALGEPCWFARTILPLSTYDADEALFSRLQHEPLGNLIFQGTAIQRLSLRHYAIDSAAPEYRWLPPKLQVEQAILWLRLSTFQVHAATLFYLVEILLPGLERFS